MDEYWLRKRIRKVGIPSLGYYNELEVFPHPLWGSFHMMFVILAIASNHQILIQLRARNEELLHRILQGFM